eukprot:CAMPEP_0117895390 /NCGR_PEP_ID=MMETSP0950-20121206/26619_1 /TAXON_ID=44440 /ORGANISM="Chattonella subsalsa, Strain CCMP2191" /LENGTH=241 /DNA_ID=CAMNT_0005756283 /DNA_START=1168 /DNA_END=1894 /DNA_ORIENTATION=-
MIRYFIPSDGDDPDHPNVFSLHNPSSSLRLHDIKQSFPLPGKFHFRFKKKFGSTHVWVDVVNEQQVVPQYEGQVVAKVERLGGGEPSNAQTCPQLQSNKHRIGRLLSLGESKEVASSIEHIKQKSAEQEADLLGTYSQQPRQVQQCLKAKMIWWAYLNPVLHLRPKPVMWAALGITSSALIPLHNNNNPSTDGNEHADDSSSHGWDAPHFFPPPHATTTTTTTANPPQPRPQPFPPFSAPQ